MPDSLGAQRPIDRAEMLERFPLPSNWTPYNHVAPDDPGMLHPDAPPILAFYMTPAGLNAINCARCAAARSAIMDGRRIAALVAASKEFRARLKHPVPEDLMQYILGDLPH